MSTPAQHLQAYADQLRKHAATLQDPRQPPSARRDVALRLREIGAQLEIISRIPPYREAT